MRNASIALLIGLAISGCSPESSPEGARECTADVIFGLWVHVNDRTTGAPMHDVVGQVHAGAFTDTLRDDGAGDGVYVALAEHPGMFSIHLEHTGYAPLDMSDIVVTSGVCHVVPTVVRVTMSATP